MLVCTSRNEAWKKLFSHQFVGAILSWVSEKNLVENSIGIGWMQADWLPVITSASSVIDVEHLTYYSYLSKLDESKDGLPAFLGYGKTSKRQLFTSMYGRGSFFWLQPLKRNENRGDSNVPVRTLQHTEWKHAMTKYSLALEKLWFRYKVCLFSQWLLKKLKKK